MSEREKAIWTRFSASEFELLENWRREQRIIPPIAATVRTLVSAGLRASEMFSGTGTGADKSEMDGKRPSIKENVG